MSVSIGVLEFSLYIRESQSLKDKRQVVRSIKDKLKNKFNIAISETGRNDNRQIAEMAIVTCSNAEKHCREMLGKIREMLASYPYAELSNVELYFY